MTLSSFLPPLAMGCRIVLMGKFDARRYLELAERHRVTHSMMVPIQFQRILAVADFDRFDLGSFRMKSCGSAYFAPSLKAEILARWPGDLIEYFGMTEGAGVCSLDARKHPDKLHTVGRPAPGHDMRVIDESGKELPPGSTGEIVGRSPTMMVGYLNQPEKTREAEWFDAEGRRFIRTGDVGRFDEDGFLVLSDRRKDMIISGGFNIYPTDIEAVMREHPDVEDIAVTGVPSTKWGESPIAFVIRRKGSALDAEQLTAWSRERLNKAQRLAAFEFVDELPRNGIGKVLKRTLRDRWTASGRSL
jgi:acyl-CoA synthetase (AMP-forming)/AMP-acid ligase II